MRRKTAFTLIELLVVIGIIGILMSIFLPTLAKVRQQALNANCASNLRQIVISCTTYAADQRGFLPMRFREKVQVYDQPFWSYLVQDKKPSPPVRYGLGLLYERKYVRAEQLFYCPGGRAHPDFNYDSFPKPWLSDLAATSPNYRTSYSYNPHYALERPGDPTSNKITAYAKLNKFPRNKALLLDLLSGPQRISHFSGGERTPSWNLAFSDGHVTLVRSKIVFDQMKLRGDLTDDAKGSDPNWKLMDDYRDLLETQADGQDPRARPPTNRVKH